jgi:AraC family L-rhamnose operon regulatory protein RhaS
MPLEKGCLTVTRPWQRHRVGLPHVQASRLHWLILDLGVRRPNQSWSWPGWFVFSIQDRRRLTILLRHNEQSVWKANAAVERCFEDIAYQLNNYAPRAAETQLKICINALFAELLRLLETKHISLQPGLSSNQRTVELFLSRLPQHLDQPWTLDDMASECGLRRSRFAYYCETITNQPPAKYLMHCRLEQAAKLLRDKPNRTITEVAFDCGLQSSQYFANVFRRAFGCTPSEWRKGGQSVGVRSGAT